MSLALPQLIGQAANWDADLTALACDACGLTAIVLEMFGVFHVVGVV